MVNDLLDKEYFENQEAAISTIIDSMKTVQIPDFHHLKFSLAQRILSLDFTKLYANRMLTFIPFLGATTVDRPIEIKMLYNTFEC